MILMVSGRTDVVAFYTEWFMNRLKEGFVDVRNPFNSKLVSRINFDNVDLIMFCTKNPKPIIPYLKEIKKPILFHITLTSYKEDIEPNVKAKGNIIEDIKEVSKIIGKENVVVRYDPILINSKYTLEYHKKSFSNMCKLLNGYVEKIIVSFVDDYKNVRKNINILNYKELTKADYKEIGESFSESVKLNKMSVQTCFEEENLVEYGFIKGECLSAEYFYKKTGKVFSKKWKARNCNCLEMVDIGVYNTCPHMCKYCYANYNEIKVKENIQKHNPNSSLLIGELEYDDIIKERL